MTRIVTLLAAALAGFAQCNFAAADGPYFSILGGSNFLQDADVAVDIPRQRRFDIEVLFDTGVAAGAALGYGWSNGFAIEGEVSYRENDIDGAKAMGTSLGLEGSESSFSAMVNALYRFDTGTPITPYFGAGVGAARLSLVIKPDFTDRVTEFAYQAIAGASYAFTPQLNVGIEYRYFTTDHPTFEDDSVTLSLDSESHELLVKLTFVP